jgi:hypothetical protein
LTGVAFKQGFPAKRMGVEEKTKGGVQHGEYFNEVAA